MSKRVLVIDDSGLTRRNLRNILERAGFTVSEAPDGMAALERYFVDKPDVVFLDLVMTGMYGLDVLTKLRELDSDARGVVFSADILTPTREAAEVAGASAFLNKPVDEREVLRTLDTVLAGGRAWS
jgi:two-component system chemotaxis response regulator CheY